ncbi:biliverdin-producing heme oxygenase [bacterium]|nr:biliverdin-producing heme oxygenase [bacterium]
MAELRMRLRDATADIHERLEQQIPVMNASFSRDDYRMLLERMLGFYEPIEQAMAEAIRRDDWELEFSARRKVNALKHDLLSLGHTRESLGKIPRAALLPKVLTREEFLGISYVLEGSTLGGNVIIRHLKSKWGSELEASQFFGIYGVGVHEKWQEFCKWLNQFSMTVSEDQVIAAAYSTFEAMEAWLTRKDST